MPGKRRLAKRLGGHRVGVVGVALDAGGELSAHALDGVAVETRVVQRKPEQSEGLVDVARQALKMARQRVAVDAKTDMDREILHDPVKGARIMRAGPLVEQVGEQRREPVLAGRILRRPAARRKFERHQWHGVALDQPSLDAAGRNDALNVFGAGFGRG